MNFLPSDAELLRGYAVTGAHADHWEAFRVLGINDRIEGNGRLMLSLSQ